MSNEKVLQKLKKTGSGMLEITSAESWLQKNQGSGDDVELHCGG